MDDLPIWGFVGEVQKEGGNKKAWNHKGGADAEAGALAEMDESDPMAPDVVVYTHKHFDIGYNGQHIVSVNVTSSEPGKKPPCPSFLAGLPSADLETQAWLQWWFGPVPRSPTATPSSGPATQPPSRGASTAT